MGLVDSEPKERGPGLADLTLLGGTQELPALIRRFDVHRVIIAFSRESHGHTLDLIRGLKDFDVQVDVVPRLYELIPPDLRVNQVEGVPLLSLPPFRLARSSQLVKRSFDLALAVPALIILTPVFAVLAVLIKLDSPGPVFFRQVRMGAGDRDLPDLQVPLHACGRRRAQARGRTPEQTPRGGWRSSDVQDQRRSTSHTDRQLASPLFRRRAPSADQRRAGGDEPRRRAASDPRRGSARRGLGTAPARPSSRDHGSLAGTRAQRHPVRARWSRSTTDTSRTGHWASTCKLILRTLPLLVRSSRGAV